MLKSPLVIVFKTSSVALTFPPNKQPFTALVISLANNKVVGFLVELLKPKK